MFEFSPMDTVIAFIIFVTLVLCVLGMPTNEHNSFELVPYECTLSCEHYSTEVLVNMGFVNCAYSRGVLERVDVRQGDEIIQLCELYRPIGEVYMDFKLFSPSYKDR